MLNQGKLLDAQTVAHYLGISVNSVYNLVRTGELKYIMIGCQYRFLPKTIETYLEKRTNAPRKILTETGSQSAYPAPD